MNITFTPGGPTTIRVSTMAIIDRVYDGTRGRGISDAYSISNASGVIQSTFIIIKEPGNQIIYEQ